MAAYLLQGLILGATAAAQPGPFQAFVLSLIARDGWRRTLPAGFAPLISDGPILVMVLLVLTQMPDWLLSTLQITGGLFLLYLAWGAWGTFRKSATVIDHELPIVEGSIRRNIYQASLMNLLNPSPYIFWATVAGPILIEAWRLAPGVGLAFLFGFYAALVGGIMLFIVIFAGAGRIDRRVNRGLSVVSALALLTFGLYQISAGMSGLGAAFI